MKLALVALAASLLVGCETGAGDAFVNVPDVGAPPPVDAARPSIDAGDAGDAGDATTAPPAFVPPSFVNVNASLSSVAGDVDAGVLCCTVARCAWHPWPCDVDRDGATWMAPARPAGNADSIRATPLRITAGPDGWCFYRATYGGAVDPSSPCDGVACDITTAPTPDFCLDVATTGLAFDTYGEIDVPLDWADRYLVRDCPDWAQRGPYGCTHAAYGWNGWDQQNGLANQVIWVATAEVTTPDMTDAAPE